MTVNQIVYVDQAVNVILYWIAAGCYIWIHRNAWFLNIMSLKVSLTENIEAMDFENFHRFITEVLWGEDENDSVVSGSISFEVTIEGRRASSRMLAGI